MAEADVEVRVRDWFDRRTHPPEPVDPAMLAGLRRGRRISVVIPARNEEATVGPIVQAVRTDLAGLVDEVLVVDSRSTDATAARARAAGAHVLAVEDVGPDGEQLDGGKGAALRTGVRHMTGDLGVFLDADVRDFGVGFVTRLLAPLLRDDALRLVKGFYDRPWAGAVPQAAGGASGGGRVTELVARPLIARHAPQLAGFVQPLAGECAFARETLLTQGFGSGYAVDVAMLLQTERDAGLDAMAQVDLGRRVHRHQDLAALGRMALQVRAAFDLVLGPADVVTDRHTLPVRDASGRTVLTAETVTTWLLGPPAAGNR